MSDEPEKKRRGPKRKNPPRPPPLPQNQRAPWPEAAGPMPPRTTGARPWWHYQHSLRACFVREYLIDMSATNAAIRAGYAPGNATIVGRTLMKMPEVRDAIQRALASRAKRVGLNADRVLDMLGRMALGNPKSVFHPDGTLKAPHELDDDDAMLVAGVKTRRIVEVNPDTGKMHNAEIQEVKLIDRTAVLALVMRHLGMNNDKLTLDVGGTLAEQLEAAMARREGGESTDVIDEESGLSESDIAALEHEERLQIEGEAVEAEWVEDDGLTPEQREMI
jgi:phage terminase small subunit